MHPDVEDLKPKLKEILYDCAVNLRATKAALYLFDGGQRFELVTEYGFRGGLRASADFNDPIVDRCGRGRTPFYINGLAVEPRFSRILYDSATDRLLAAPLYSRGKLIGYVDMRDKAGKVQFDNEDLPKAQGIADRLVNVFAEKNFFGHRFIALSTEAGPVAARPAAPPPRPEPEPAPEPVPDIEPFFPASEPVAPPLPKPPAQPPQTARTHLPPMATLVIDARAAARRILMAPVTETLSEAEIVAAREVLRAALLLPGAVVATFSAFVHLGGIQEIAARTDMTDEAKSFIQSKLAVWLAKRGQGGGGSFARTNLATPLGASGAPLRTNDLQKVFTAPLHVGAMRGLYLTVAFNNNPDRAVHELLAVLHNHLQIVLEQSMQRGALSAFHARAAEKLVEPDFTAYPELRRHSGLVSKLCESFTTRLAMSPADVETARIAGLVHDCGLRLLDYDRLYRKRDLTAEELAFLREHPGVSAAMIEPVLGTNLARIVLCHHERFDGTGYPNHLRGDEIPHLSRVLAICDAWVSITDPESYQAPETRESAIATMSRVSGSQLDGELVAKFLEMVRAAG